MIDKELIPLGEIAARTPNSFVDGPFGSEMKSDEYTETGVRLIQLQNIGDGAWIDLTITRSSFRQTSSPH